MSATNRGAVRKAHDFYPTPPAAFEPIFQEFKAVAFSGQYSWLEPAAGDDRIYNRMPAPKAWAEIQRGRDYLARPYYADICLTNPPFCLSLDFAEKALRECRTVLFLQKLNWLGSDERRPFWQAHPPTHLFPLASRPSFSAETVTAKVVDLFEIEVEVGGKKRTDSAEYAWFAWDGLDILRRPPGIYVI